MTKKRKRKTPLDRAVARMESWFATRSKALAGLSRFARISVAAIILVTLAALGLSRLDDYVQSLPTVRASQVVVSFHRKPDWMSDALAREILETAAKPILGPLAGAHRRGEDHLLPELLAGGLQNNAWIACLNWVRRCGGGQLIVDCDFRRPAAIVCVGDVRYLIDTHGYLLPGEYTAQALRRCDVPNIRGCAGSAPAIGMRWANADLLSALDVAKQIATMDLRHQVKFIDVANFAGRLDVTKSWIVLITDRDSVIRWGLPPGEERGLQISSSEKLATLSGFYRHHGHIDKGRAWVDIRWSRTEVDVSIASAGTAHD